MDKDREKDGQGGKSQSINHLTVCYMYTEVRGFWDSESVSIFYDTPTINLTAAFYYPPVKESTEDADSERTPI